MPQDLHGGALTAHGEEAASWEECCELCGATADCGAWTFVPPESRCWLKAQGAGMVAKERLGMVRINALVCRCAGADVPCLLQVSGDRFVPSTGRGEAGSATTASEPRTAKGATGLAQFLQRWQLGRMMGFGAADDREL